MKHNLGCFPCLPFFFSYDMRSYVQEHNERTDTQEVAKSSLAASPPPGHGSRCLLLNTLYGEMQWRVPSYKVAG